MPEIALEIGGRSFRVACEPGQEPNLKQAAALLDAEAGSLQSAIGRIPEPRMLLMAGLMLADRTIEIAKQLEAAQGEITALQDAVSATERRAAASSADSQLVQDLKAREKAVLEMLESTATRLEALTTG